MIIVGDIGGTKTQLALYKIAPEGDLRNKALQVASRKYQSAQYDGLSPILEDFLKDHPQPIQAACFGIPGPVIDGVVRTPNLPWIIHQSEVAKRISCDKVKLVNDLVAITASLPHLATSELITLNPGSPRPGVKVVLAPGTGTGQGFLCPVGGQEIPFASEGGHVNFAPTNDIEDRLLQYLRKKIGGRVSMERILCGPGIMNIYDFLKSSGLADEPAPLQERLATGDQAAIISAAALAGEFPICSETIRIFSRILGTHAGDLVLTYMATGGVYLAGGIPPKLARLLESETVLSGYTDKGRFTDLVRSVPLYIIKDEKAALTGACSIAISLLE